ncbi:N-acetylneuraminate synthase [Clostridium peptidivorans]|uniref:N-acetylneuraminate synthase n=1 Tax=Clostridium peptidivorans TaxID=100174 RepID=UPI000BE28A91|nr:N-acetylneuraminate synthase [Clostridium peptidivorans]
MSTYIIAEAGVNHNGNLELAKLMIDKAKEAGANCIKFQTFISKNIVSKNASKAQYQKQYTKLGESQLDMLKKLELSFDDFKELKKYCDLKEIEFFSTAFDLDSINFLNGLGMRIWKIPSGEITNLPYLIEIAKTHKPVILSTGMSTVEEVEEAINILRTNGCQDIILLHCTTEYPAPYEEVNLKAMNTLKEKFNVMVGYSDHTKGTEVTIAAVAMGATVIEKHFTLDRNMEGPDHKSSLEPNELKTMVNAIRNIEKAMGNGKKIPSPSERKNINIARKSIVAKCNIKKGEILSEDNIITKRPGNGISPMRWFDIIGKTAIKDFEEDELIEI